MSDTKQVIVMRKDLGMRRGKECAQAAHASIAFLTRRLRKATHFDLRIDPVHLGNIADQDLGKFAVNLTESELQWLASSFKKVCLQVDSEAELDAIAVAAKDSGLEVHVVVDSGLTEFNGVPTKTCLAIGPDSSEKIDKVTGHLKLY